MEAASPRPADETRLGELRERFVEIAARRVEPSAVEDVVQDALKIVVEKSAGAAPRIDWCFQVLRNVIGNHYRRARTRRRFVVEDGTTIESVATGQRQLAALEEEEAAMLIREGIDSTGSPCRDYLGRLADGSSVASIATAEAVAAAVLYRRLYRCRQKLRQWLRARGVIA